MSLIISTIIFLLINFIFLNPLNLNQNLEDNNQKNKNNFISKIIQKDKFENNEAGNNNEENIKKDFWFIEIPSISLKAPINSGVDLTTLQNYVGHFDETSLNYGNIGLAAHNRRVCHQLFRKIKGC